MGKQRKLKDLEKETGFPVFVCPPIGHPKDSQGRAPLLLIDSSVTEQKKPLLFDCGSVGLSIMPSEFTMMARAVCIEGLAKDPPPDAEVTPRSGAGTVDVKEAGNDTPPKATNIQLQALAAIPSTEMPICGPPQILAPEGVPRQAGVQQPARATDLSSDAAMGS